MSQRQRTRQSLPPVNNLHQLDPARSNSSNCCVVEAQRTKFRDGTTCSSIESHKVHREVLAKKHVYIWECVSRLRTHRNFDNPHRLLVPLRSPIYSLPICIMSQLWS